MRLAGVAFAPLTRPVRAAIWIYAVLSALAAFTWAATFVEILPLRTRIPLTDYGAPLGGIALLFLVPVALPVCRVLKKRGRFEPAPHALKQYIQLTNIFLLVSLYLGAQTVLFYVLLAASNR